MENQIAETNNSVVTKVSINSIEEMDNFLVNLQSTASESLAAALSAQLQVIRYVSSPQLVNSTFDLLFQNLKKSIDYADSHLQKVKLREQGTLMINNYVFFMKAKLEYSIQNNRKEGDKLLQDAGVQLTKSVTEIVSLVAVPERAAVKVIVAKNLFANIEEYRSLFTRMMDFFNKKSRNKKKVADFHDSLASLIGKLDRRKALLGQSDLISELINNYAEDLSIHATSHLVILIEQTKAKIEELVGKTMEHMLNIAVVTGILFAICSIIIVIVRWIAFGAENIFGATWITIVSIIFGSIIGVSALFYLTRYILLKINYKKLKSEYVHQYNSTYNNYRRIAEEFEEQY